MQTTIRLATPDDAAAIAAIYNPYVLDTPVSFEEEAVSPAEMAARIEEVLLSGLPWLVAVREGQIVAYAYASKWKGRCAYRFSVETSIYSTRATHRSGLGTALYAVLLDHLRALNQHVVIAGIALPTSAASPCTRNSASRRWRTSRKWASSAANGATWATGN